ncbi:MAG: MBL fold metallo-hydrolase [bacterium]|nr:MBL fold metallo-hydrolase [Candidatus Kapabacteria bacterium]
MRITVLGSGTSSGVPTIGCSCATCLSDDPHDKRLRTSIWIEAGTTSIVVDTSNDFRAQCLRANIKALDAVLYTHHHFDHIAGFDDIRAFNFAQRRPMAIYAMPETIQNLRRIFEYAFRGNEPRESSAPVVVVHEILDDAFDISGVQLQPLELRHGRMRVNGYRCGSFAYCTDCNAISERARELLHGIDVLILDGLRYSPHPTHLTIDQAVELAQSIGARQTYLTHIAHDVRHVEAQERLPAGVALAYDGLVIELPDPQGI